MMEVWRVEIELILGTGTNQGLLGISGTRGLMWTGAWPGGALKLPPQTGTRRGLLRPTAQGTRGYTFWQ